MQEFWLPLLEAASLAPSGDNRQPWRFIVDEKQSLIRISLDRAKDISPMNFNQRMARIALGCAVENIFQAGLHNGFEIKLDSITADYVSLFVSAKAHSSYEIPPVIIKRETNRRRYHRKEILNESFSVLCDRLLSLEEVKVHWIIDRTQLSQLANAVACADVQMFRYGPMRRSFLENIQFGSNSCEIEEGLPIQSLEISHVQSLLLRLLPWMPEGLFNGLGIAYLFGRNSRQLVESSSGLCLLTTTDRADSEIDIKIGQTLQRAWLTLTENGFAVQPMMSLCILENALESNVAQKLKSEIRKIRKEVTKVIPQIPLEERLAAIFRFGFAPPATARTRRIPFEKLTTIEEKTDGMAPCI